MALLGTSLILPGSHLPQVVAPVDICAVPGKHMLHIDFFSTSAGKFQPWGQSSHGTFAPANEENLPGQQSVHSVARPTSPEYCPASQSKQKEGCPAAKVKLNLPWAQSVDEKEEQEEKEEKEEKIVRFY